MELYPYMGISKISEKTGETYNDIRRALSLYGVPITPVKIQRNKKIKPRKPIRDAYYENPYTTKFDEALREEVRKAFGRKCFKCGVHESDLRKKLDVHHRDWNKRNNTVANLIPLCHSCHMRLVYHERI